MILWLAITATVPLIRPAASPPCSGNQRGDDAHGFPGAIAAVPLCPIQGFLLPTPPVSDAILLRAQSEKPAMSWNDQNYGEGSERSGGRDTRNRSVGRWRAPTARDSGDRAGHQWENESHWSAPWCPR